MKRDHDTACFPGFHIKATQSGAVRLADSGFGIFSVADRSQRRSRDFLLRLTKRRYRSYLKKATPGEEGPGPRTHHPIWKPSAKERKNHRNLPADAFVKAFIHQVDLDNGQTLELVTNIEAETLSGAGLYRRRYDVEFDIRDL